MAVATTRKKPPGKAVDKRNDRSTTLAVKDSETDLVVPEPSGKWLKDTKDRWDIFWGSELVQLVQPVDEPALSRLFEYYDEWERMIRDIRKEGRTSIGSQGQEVLNPKIGYLQKLESNIVKLEADFGLTPMARLKLGIAFGEAQRGMRELDRLMQEDHDNDTDEAGGEDTDWLEGYVVAEGS